MDFSYVSVYNYNGCLDIRIHYQHLFYNSVMNYAMHEFRSTLEGFKFSSCIQRCIFV